MASEAIDLSRIIASHPLRTVTLRASDLDVSKITLDDLVALSEILDVAPMELEAAIAAGDVIGQRRAVRWLQAFAWRILIRDPHYAAMTWQEASVSLSVDVIDDRPTDPTPAPVPLRPRRTGRNRSSRSR